MDKNQLIPQLRRILDRELTKGRTMIIVRHIDGYLCMAHEDIDNERNVAGGLNPGYRIAFIVRPNPKRHKKAGRDRSVAALVLSVLKNIFKPSILSRKKPGEITRLLLNIL